MGSPRNLSCTPLFSKVLEAYVLEYLKKQTKFNASQYGGIKGSGTDHFLTSAWNEIMIIFEDSNASASLVSIDFEKAFNRMSHPHCLRSLHLHGASAQIIKLVYEFLDERMMSVRIGEEMSGPRHAPGGSPQGSILGNYLFCMATDTLEDNCHFPDTTKQPETPQACSEIAINEGLARIISDRPSALGLNNITVVGDVPELCIPFERNGVTVREEAGPLSPAPSPSPMARINLDENDIGESTTPPTVRPLPPADKKPSSGRSRVGHIETCCS